MHLVSNILDPMFDGSLPLHPVITNIFTYGFFSRSPFLGRYSVLRSRSLTCVNVVTQNTTHLITTHHVDTVVTVCCWRSSFCFLFVSVIGFSLQGPLPRPVVCQVVWCFPFPFWGFDQLFQDWYWSQFFPFCFPFSFLVGHFSFATRGVTF